MHLPTNNTIKIDNFEKLIILLCLFVSSGVMYGWYAKIYPILNLLPESHTMKFNTAIVFLIVGVFLIIQRIRSKNTVVLCQILASFLVLIGTFTIIEYLGWPIFSLDNFFVTDSYSKNNPGRMSPASALSSMLVGVGLLTGQSNNSTLKKLGLYSFKLVGFVALIAIIAFILIIPLANKATFFKSMAIHTSLLFLLIAVSQLLKNPDSIFFNIMTGNFAGSKIMRKILPLIIILPIVSSYLLIVGINRNIVNVDFGIVTYAAIFIPVCIIYVSYISIGLNKTEAERFKLENKLRESNRYLEQFKHGVDQASIVAMTNRQGIITEVNDTFCEISQYSRAELIGNTHSIVNSGYHENSFFQNMWETISSGKIWVDEIKNKAKDGSYYWVLTAIVPFKNEEDIITEYMALRQDVTVRKRAEELRLSYVKKLEYKNKELEQFAYVASHDLQEPLRTVINFTDLLASKRSESVDDISLKSIQYIQEATLRMSQLIKSLLDYNRIDKDNKLTLVDCNKLIKGIENDLSKSINESEAKISYFNLPSVIGYETPLRLLFQNLITNGIKFRKKGTKPHIIIKASQNNHEWIFSVKDNGIGISLEHQEKIFIIFQRLHTKDKYEGSGIGLAHCSKIADLHGGKIWVDSQPNEGSNFKFTIRTVVHERKS